MESVARWDHVTKVYRGRKALDAVTLDVPRGVVYAVLGENGAGKTTALKIALGLVDADAGATHVLGLDSRKQGSKSAVGSAMCRSSRSFTTG